MAKYRPLMLAFCVLLLLLTACDASREAAENTRDDGEVQATLWSERKWYEEGEPVHLRLTLTNITDTSIVLERADGRPIADLTVEDNTPLYWSEGPGTEQDLKQLILQPGEPYVIEWILTLEGRGGFLVRGTWWNTDLQEQSVPLVICQGQIGYCP